LLALIGTKTPGVPAASVPAKSDAIFWKVSAVTHKPRAGQRACVPQKSLGFSGGPLGLPWATQVVIAGRHGWSQCAAKTALDTTPLMNYSSAIYGMGEQPQRRFLMATVHDDARLAVLAMAEIKAAVERFEGGDCNVFDALDRIEAALPRAADGAAPAEAA
jgi:hypothetical protein